MHLKQVFVVFLCVALSLFAAVTAEAEDVYGVSLLQTSARLKRNLVSGPISAAAAQSELNDTHRNRMSLQETNLQSQSGIDSSLHIVEADVFPAISLNKLAPNSDNSLWDIFCTSLVHRERLLTRAFGVKGSSTQTDNNVAGTLALIALFFTVGCVMVYAAHTPGSTSVSTPQGKRKEHSGALTFLASMVIGSIASCLYFVFNAPGAIELSLQDTYGVTPTQMGWILGTYSVAGSFTPLFAYFIIRVAGLKITGLIYVGLIGTGAILFALSPLFGSWMLTVMLIGRALTGLGVGVIVLSRTASNWWFKGGQHESMSYGVILVMEQAMGSALPFIFLPGLEVNFANWISVLVCSMSVTMVGVYSLLERAHMPELSRGESWMAASKLSASTGEGAIAEYLKGVAQFDGLFSCQCFAHFYIISILYVFATTFPYFLVQHGMTPNDAGRACAITYLCVALAPVAGALSDRLGQRLRLQFMCSAIGCVAFLSYEVTAPDPWTICLVLGLCFAVLEQNSYSLMGRIVQHLDDELASTAFSIMTVFLESGLIGLPVLVGYMGRDGDFSNSPRLFAFFMGSGAVVTLLMAVLDSTGFLNGTNQPKDANAGD